MIGIPLISSRFFLVEVQDSKDNRGKFFLFFADFQITGQLHKIYQILPIKSCRFFKHLTLAKVAPFCHRFLAENLRRQMD
jgi:hypothetical protein